MKQLKTTVPSFLSTLLIIYGYFNAFTAVFMLVDHSRDVACNVPTKFWLWWFIKNVVRHSWIICGTGLKASVGVESCSIRIVTVGICCIRKLVRTITIETAMAKSNHRSDRHCRSIFFFRKQLFRSLKKISRASWRKSLLPAVQT
mgnify:CR=1 FL=1